MVRLPMSDDAASYYKEQRIEFTFRQQAHFCWAYDPLLKDRMKSLREILEISDDERLNMEIRQRLAYEEEIYARFMANDMDGCIYVVHPDDENEYEDGYFRSAQSAIAYGTGELRGGLQGREALPFGPMPPRAARR